MRILDTLRQREIKILILLMTIFYVGIVVFCDFAPHVQETMFKAADSKSYKAVGDWIFGFQSTSATIIRPFFYPLLLNVSRSFAGVYGIWFVQFLLWLLAGILIFCSLQKMTNNKYFACIGVIIFTTNITLILLTLRALTEVTATCLLAIALALIVHKERFTSSLYWLLLLFIADLLTVTKPVYFPIVFLLLVYQGYRLIMMFRHERYYGGSTSQYRKRNLKYVIFCMLALSPVLIQLTIMQTRHHTFAISKIGGITAKQYAFAKLYGELHDLSIKEARTQINPMNRHDMLTYVATHFPNALKLWAETILYDNLKTRSDFTNFPFPHPFLFRYMEIVNASYFYCHAVMILPVIFTVLLSIKRRRYDILEMLFSLLCPILLVILTSGLTFFQGDRIVLPILPLWLALYLFVLSKLNRYRKLRVW